MTIAQEYRVKKTQLILFCQHAVLFILILFSLIIYLFMQLCNVSELGQPIQFNLKIKSQYISSCVYTYYYSQIEKKKNLNINNKMEKKKTSLTFVFNSYKRSEEFMKKLQGEKGVYSKNLCSTIQHVTHCHFSQSIVKFTRLISINLSLRPFLNFYFFLVNFINSSSFRFVSCN